MPVFLKNFGSLALLIGGTVCGTVCCTVAASAEPIPTNASASVAQNSSLSLPSVSPSADPVTSAPSEKALDQEHLEKMDLEPHEGDSQETSTMKSRMKDLLRQKKFADDSEITDTKLKADEGSRSEYSLKFNLSYNGPPVGDLNSPRQPNPDGSIGTYDTRIGGSIAARLRLSPETAISVGSGVTALQPVQGVSRYDVNNPFVTYDFSSRWLGLQWRNAFTLTDTTNPDYNAVGETGGASYTNYAVYNIPHSKFALELDSSLSYWFFNRGYVASDKTAGSYFLTFYPYLKYNATERLNINTSLAIQYMNPRSANDDTSLNNKTVTQQLAFGYAFTRDIYFSPYINFYPSAMATNSTTINFTTTFSLL